MTIPECPLNIEYVSRFLKNVGVRIKAEPGEYSVVRRIFDGHGGVFGPSDELRIFEDLHEAFVYGLRLALLPPFHYSVAKSTPPRPGHNARAYEIRKRRAEERRHEIEAYKASVRARRDALIHAELVKLNAQV